MSCADFEKFVSAFVDGELDVAAIRELERHRDSCERCAAVFEDERATKRAVRAGMRRALAPVALRERIRASLDRVDAAPRTRRSAWVVPLAAAAAIAFVWFGGAAPGGGGGATQAGLFDVGANLHAKNLPVEVQSQDPENVAGWLRGKVDFKVRPPRLPKRGSKLVGARLSHVGDRQAVQLVYDVGGGRVTVLVFEANRTLAEGRVRRVRNRVLRLGHAHGYHGAFVRSGDLGYLVVSDFGQSETARMAAQVR